MTILASFPFLAFKTGAVATIAVAPHILVPTAMSSAIFLGILKIERIKRTRNIVKDILGTTTIKELKETFKATTLALHKNTGFNEKVVNIHKK